jgi:hypothetical protein
MKIGIMQGRLSEPVNGHMQEFPENWETEFAIMKEQGFVGAEWLLTKNCFLNNPLITNTEKVAQCAITSICFDVLVDERIIEESFLKDNLVLLCETLMKTAIRNITIPLLEESSMVNDETREQFCRLIAPIGEQFPEIQFSFEAELDYQKLHEIIALSDNFYVTYDTGNMTSCRFDHAEYINFFGSKINNVHLKDRTFQAQTVAPLTGNTDFPTIFTTLHNIGYKGPYILQTARNITGQEVETMLKHKYLFEQLYEQSI